MAPAIRLGLTGGIGSGKSTVARILMQGGAAVVDADAISRELTSPGGLAIPLIANAFGQHVLTSAGALDRVKMRTIAFSEPLARKCLEAIIHPLVGHETERQSQVAEEAGALCIVFDIPLLVESPVWRKNVHQVLVIDCTTDVQVQRVMARNQLSKPEVEKIILTQTDRARRVRAADTVIFNVDLSLTELADEVHQIWHRFGLSSK